MISENEEYSSCKAIELGLADQWYQDPKTFSKKKVIVEVAVFLAVTFGFVMTFVLLFVCIFSGDRMYCGKICL